MPEGYTAWLVYTKLDKTTIAAAAVVEKGDKSALLADKIQVESDDVDVFATASVAWIKSKLAGKGDIQIKVQSEVFAMSSSEVLLSRSIPDFDRYIKAYRAFSNFRGDEYTPRRRRKKSEEATTLELPGTTESP